MKKYVLSLIAFIFTSFNVHSQCNQGLSPNQGFRGQTLTTTITNNQLFFGNGSAPCSPSDVYLYHQATSTTIYASTLSINNDSVRVSWNIPSNAPGGIYNLTLQEYIYSTLNGNCLIGPTICYIPQAFGINVSKITGSVFYDDNMDSIYNGIDLLLPQQKLIMLPEGIITFTDANGNYSFFADTGAHTIKILNGIDFYSITSDSIVVNVGQSNVTNQDFAIYPNSFAFRTTAYLSGRPRCNTVQNYTIDYQSHTVIPVNLLIKFYKSSNVSFSGSSIPPDSVNGDTVYFSVFNFTYGSGNFTMQLNIPGQGSLLNMGIIVETYDLNSNLVHVFSAPFNQTVQCSFDPNDKSVNPPGEYAQHYTLFGDTLYYRIRFQNTGTDTAYTVHILDTLNSNLDINTFRLVSSSHPVIVELNSNGVVDFHFYNIMLPDSNIDEPASNGYVAYTINALNGLSEMTVINNTANIYFDQNLPVVTNTTENTLVSNLTIGIQNPGSRENIVMFPNPFNSFVTIRQINDKPLAGKMIIRDIQGREISNNSLNGSAVTIDLHYLAKGIYTYMIYDSKNEVLSYGKMIKQ